MRTLSIELVGELGDEQLKRIAQTLAHIDEACFPASWQYDDAAEFYMEALTLGSSIALILIVNERIVGHLLAVPLQTVLSELVEFDPEIACTNPNAYYVDTLAVLPHLGWGSLRKFVTRLEFEIRARNVPTLTMHVRVSTGLSRVVQRYFAGRVLTVRRLERWEWYAKEEAADFIEVKIEKEITPDVLRL